MNLLLINQVWLADEFRSLGLRVTTCGYGDQFDVKLPDFFLSIREIQKLLPSDFKTDFAIIYDDGAPLSIIELSSAPFLTIFYSVDTHHMLFLHQRVENLVDLTTVAQKCYSALSNPLSKTRPWIPLWCSKLMDISSTKDRDATFIGTINPSLHPLRAEFLNQVKELAPLEILQGDFSEIYPKSKIVLNQTVNHEINFRVFEALGSGALLITESDAEGLNDLFTPNENIAVYSRHDAKSAANQINYFLTNQSAQNKVAKAGLEICLSNHLPINRANTFLELLTNLKKNRDTHLALESELFVLLVSSLSFYLLGRPSAFKGLDLAFRLYNKISAHGCSLDQSLNLLLALAFQAFRLELPNTTVSPKLMLLSDQLEINNFSTKIDQLNQNQLKELTAKFLTNLKNS